MRSLRQRAIVGGVIWAIMIIGLGGAALFTFFDNLTQSRFDEALLDRHLQVIVALSNSGADAEIMSSYLTDAAYQRPYSGRYWQVTGSNETKFTSRSLFDALLSGSEGASAIAKFWEDEGPMGNIRGIHQEIGLVDGSIWVVSVAESLSALKAERLQIRKSLLATFALVGVLGIAAAILQTSTVVRPLTKLREDVAHRWDAQESLDPTGYPEEVSPLVSDINTLLDRNREIVERARRRAADLAHALKTPSAILRNELEALSEKEVDVQLAIEALDRVDAQLLNSFARIRAANTGTSTHSQTNLGTSVERLVRLFRKLPDTSSKTIKINMEPDINIPMNEQDIEEVLGNLLENALQWADGEVQITCIDKIDNVLIVIEDDGPGISEEDRQEALRSGGRLDTSAPGTGLGLAIAADLLQAYGGTLDLGQSEGLGGLQVSMTIPDKIV